MKKILAFLVVSIAMVSCYDDYIFDNTYSGVYFFYQTDVRTFVVGEGMEVKVGAYIGGIRENTRDRNVSFILDNSLITPDVLTKMKNSAAPYISGPTAGVSTLLPLPASYYTLSDNSNMVIKSGEHSGYITVKPDSAMFLADAATSKATYVLPFYIVDADADSILASKRTSVVAFRYENMLFGKYWHGGSALVNRPGKADTTLNYFTTKPMAETKIWTLTTTAPDALYANGFFDQVTSKNEMKLTLANNTITISPVTGSTYTVAPEGESSYNNARLLQERKIFLKYKYTNTVSGYTYHCTDTISFRNRLRDGINEWQDENPSHYTK